MVLHRDLIWSRRDTCPAVRCECLLSEFGGVLK
jgi:hypothetical protein